MMRDGLSKEKSGKQRSVTGDVAIGRPLRVASVIRDYGMYDQAQARESVWLEPARRIKPDLTPAQTPPQTSQA